MRYWWVNHKQTSKFEIAGGFLWSPMRKANGSRNQFYENMRKASPGDAVMSFSHAKIQHVGFVTDFATPSPKPPSFGKTGENWNKINGWLLPVKWNSLSVPVIPKDRILEFGDNLPSKYSPLDPLSGKGRENAYLAEVSFAVYDVLMGGVDLNTFPENFLSDGLAATINDIENAIEKEILKDDSLDPTVVKSLKDGRLGQGVFRRNILEFERLCRLRRISNPALLVASHIKPWRLCSTASERLDGANGLLLSPDVDRLFDRGFISFHDNGMVLVSPRLKEKDIVLMGLKKACSISSGDFHARQRAYLSFHRDVVFMA